jgi:hypothetical protein
MRNFVSLTRRLLCVAALFVVCTQCWAQGNIRSVLFVKLKPGHDDNWKATVKDYIALQKKAGSEQSFTIWESQSGPELYAVVWYSAKWKELGEDDPKMKGHEAELSSLFRRFDADTDSLDKWVDEIQPDLHIVSKEIPAYVRTGRTRVESGKMDEALAALRSDVMPAVKKSGATSFGIGVGRFGTLSNEIHSYLGISGWGDFDGPVGAEKGMTPAEWKAWQAKIGPLIEGTQWDVWKYEPDLSYMAPAK